MLGVAFVLSIHADQIAAYGGLTGVRDLASLESALAQVDLEVFKEQLHPAPELRAAALLYHVIRNHPFIDGNKRTAWAATEVQLLLEGFALDLDDDAIYTLVNEVAAGKYDKEHLAGVLLQAMRPA